MILYDNEAWLIDKGYDRIGIRISRSFTLFSILGGGGGVLLLWYN